MTSFMVKQFPAGQPVFYGFVVECQSNGCYSCITDSKGKINIRAQNIFNDMPNIKRGIFIQCQEAPQKISSSLVYNPMQTTVLASLASWTYNYINSIHLIHFICSKLIQPGVNTQDILNLLIPLSWDINPTPAHMYRLILILFNKVSSMPHSHFFENEIMNKDKDIEWYNAPLIVPDAPTVYSNFMLCIQYANLHGENSMIFDSLIRSAVANEIKK